MQTVLKKIRVMFIINIFLFLFLSLVEYFLDNEAVLKLNWLYNFVYYAVYGFVIGTFNEIYFSLIYKNVKIEAIQPKKFVFGFLGSIPVGLLGVFVSRFIILVFMKGQTLEYFFKNQHKADYFFSSLITVVIVLIFHLVYFYKSNQEKKINEQKIIAGTASAKFESLKNQIDPHFLFNSLNVLTSLIEENPDQAQRFTTSLSKVYRYVLEQKDKELISVDEELSFAKTYMNLLKMRFENSISFELPTDFSNPEAKVVPLSLQLLLENTIKHNVVSEKKPLHIRIYIANDYLIVENNLQKKEVLQDRKGVGLQNIVYRYGLISARKVMVEENATYFKVFIPILTKQVAMMETQNIYNENIAYTKAKERVEKLRGFYGNLISYCCVIPFLIFINLKTSDFYWFWFPALGWGMGLFFHAVEVFGFGKNWEERKIQEILRKDEQQRNKWS